MVIRIRHNLSTKHFETQTNVCKFLTTLIDIAATEENFTYVMYEFLLRNNTQNNKYLYLISPLLNNEASQLLYL